MMTDAEQAPNGARLRATPITITEAKRFVARFHRHRVPPQGALFAVGRLDPDSVEATGAWQVTDVGRKAVEIDFMPDGGEA